MKQVISIIFFIVATSCSSSSTNESAGQYFDSATITAQVKTALAREKNIKSLNINVETYKNIVQLSGFVDEKSQKKKAEDVANNIQGVKRVLNSIEVKSEL